MAKEQKLPYVIEPWPQKGKDHFLVKNLDSEWLGEVYPMYDHSGWKVEVVASNHDYEALKRLKFPTKEVAADALYTIRKTVDAITSATPLPETVMQFLEREADQLRREQQEIEGRLLHVRGKQAWLLEIAKTYGVERIKWSTKDSDAEAVVRKLLEFTLEFGKKKVTEHPFFSEATLYELIGKEDARSVLALLKQVVGFVSPSKATEL